MHDQSEYAKRPRYRLRQAGVALGRSVYLGEGPDRPADRDPGLEQSNVAAPSTDTAKSRRDGYRRRRRSPFVLTTVARSRRRGQPATG
ncbi:hypothetical protein FRAAL6350 [Frankia alni ACN14a]|uniref:Uncharacterized protein n=1 Tax=Frankia alni (strain DSM 45986 / CECT 9034 / ACN14a) TaxID=326424 RepID=Q0RC55_FRAAA|nr:hypothetical protein FRAAL6350 [Frankia alni ACN14a]